MKRILMLFLVAMTFVSCGGSMFGKGEAAELNLAGIGFVDADRSAGDVYEITLDFVGTAPTCDNFEKTKTTTDPESISYSITGLHVGEKVQLKLTIKKNGALIAEGVSQEKTLVFGDNSLTISMRKMRDWVFTYENIQDEMNSQDKFSLKIFDKNFGDNKEYNNQELVIDDFTSGSVKDFCTDDEGNLYVFMVEQNGSQDEEGRIYRYRPGNGDYREKQLLYPGFPWNFYDDSYEAGDMYYDPEEDALYVMGFVSVESVDPVGYYPHYRTYKFEKPGESTGLGNIFSDTDPYPYYKDIEAIIDYVAFSKSSMAVYDNTVYYAGRMEDSGTFYLIVKTDDKQLVLLKDYTYDISSWVDGLDITQSLSTNDVKIADMAVNETGIYILLSNTKDSIPVGGATGYSRGALIKVDLDLTTARAIGWANSIQHIRSMYSTETDMDKLTYYSPKTIKDGFFGPQKILAIKPKELVFADDGAGVYVTGDNDHLEVNQMNHVVSVDLEQLTYSAVETDMKFFVEPSLSGADCHYVETWE